MATPSPAERSATSSSGPAPAVGGRRAEAVVDLNAISANTERLRSHAGGRDVMAVVKADGYGHGIEQAAWAARRGGATWLGVAFLDEALRLRAAGDRGPILSWLAVPGESYGDGIAADVELAAYTVGQLSDIADSAGDVGARAKVQLKLDSGLGRGGSHPDEWPQLVDEAVAQEARGRVRITGVWSHFACSDEPDHPSVAAQLATYRAGVEHATASGLDPDHLHLANSGGALAIPDSWFTMVRPGIAIYGVSPFADGGSPVELTPAMTLRATLALVKRVHAGQGVSYGHTYVTDRETTLGLVPLGYGDGIPRVASNRGVVDIGGTRFTVAGRVCMDQFVVDLGDQHAAAGDEVIVFGDGRSGEPTAHDWARASDSIGYEVVTRIGPRVPRVYVGDST
jgi:alanine racemase